MSIARSTTLAWSSRSTPRIWRWSEIGFSRIWGKPISSGSSNCISWLSILGIEGIPRERVRLHVCWGNSDGPHVHDIAMATILPELYRANVGALSIEFANPRHQHEYDALRNNPLPAHMLLMPGVLDSTTNFVEHPELVARRIEEAVSVVGDRERVIAGTDCGFGTFAGREYVAEEVVWVKLAAAAEGARIASHRLWGRAVG